MFEKISNKRVYAHVTVHVPRTLITASDTICLALGASTQYNRHRSAWSS